MPQPFMLPPRVDWEYTVDITSIGNENQVDSSLGWNSSVRPRLKSTEVACAIAHFFNRPFLHAWAIWILK